MPSKQSRLRDTTRGKATRAIPENFWLAAAMGSPRRRAGSPVRPRRKPASRGTARRIVM